MWKGVLPRNLFLSVHPLIILMMSQKWLLLLINSSFCKISLFYLKLQAKLLLPATTIQTIIEGYQDVHDISLTNLLNNLSDKLTVLGAPEAIINNIMVELRKEDLLAACNSGPLSTDQKRKNIFIIFSLYLCSWVMMIKVGNHLPSM